MAGSNTQIVTGTITATGAELNIPVGFIPRIFRIHNVQSQCSLVWDEKMTQIGICMKNSPWYFRDATLRGSRPSIGSTNTAVANQAFEFAIASVKYQKAAVAAGTAITATTVPAGLWGAFGHQIVAAGTYTTYDAPGNGTGYATEKLALAALLGVTPTASNVPVHCITVMRVGATFVGATTPLNTVGLTVNYYPIASCGLTNPYQGLWPYAGSVSSQGGMTLGVEPDININLDTLIWEAHS